MAAPSNISASGSFVTGGVVNVTGLNFGTKSPVKPALWCDFTGGVNGTIDAPGSLGIATAWTTGDAGMSHGGMRADAAAGRISGKAGIRLNSEVYTDPGGINPTAYVMGFRTSGWYANALSQKWFSWRVLKRFFQADNGVTDGNAKTYLIQPYPDRYSGVANCVQNEGQSQIQTQDVSQPSPGYDYFFPSGTFSNSLAWQIQEHVVQVYSSYQHNCDFKFIVNGNMVGNAVNNVADQPRICLRGSSGEMNWDQLNPIYQGLFHQTSGTSSQFQTYYDEVYVDNCWSRVYVGDRSTWAETLGTAWTKQICVPTAWSDTAIAVVFRQGTFTAGQTRYLYIINANGEVNATGYQVTIGASGGSPPTGTPVLSVR